MAVETQMFQKKIRPVHVVSVMPPARASTSHFEHVLQGAVILNHDDCPSNNPHLLVSEDGGVACKCHKPKEEGLELCVCAHAERGWQHLPAAFEAEETCAKLPQ